MILNVLEISFIARFCIEKPLLEGKRKVQPVCLVFSRVCITKSVWGLHNFAASEKPLLCALDCSLASLSDAASAAFATASRICSAWDAVAVISTAKTEVCCSRLPSPSTRVRRALYPESPNCKPSQTRLSRTRPVPSTETLRDYGCALHPLAAMFNSFGGSLL